MAMALAFFLSIFFHLFLLVLTIASSCTSSNSNPYDTSGLSRETFPSGFTFGTAASAYQVEGAIGRNYGRGPSIWDEFISTKPDRIAYNGTADLGIDEYHRYKEDIDMMVEMSMDAYRFSISWPRIFPFGRGYVNKQGVDYYNKLINYMVEKGIEPYATLYHYDLPDIIERAYGGLLNTKIAEDFANYAEFCFEVFGDRVKNWMTFNEPHVVAKEGYDDGIFPPGRCSKPYFNCTAGNSAVEPYIVAHNIILSHAAAAQRYREKYQDKQKGRIGIALDFVWYEPLTKKFDDIAAAQRARDFNFGWFLHPLTHGEYPETMQAIVGERLPVFTDQERKMVKGSLDFVGINQYTAYYAYDPHKEDQIGRSYEADMNVQYAFEREGVPIGPRAHSFWLYIVPWGMYKVLNYVKENYNNPVMVITENGMDTAANLTMLESLSDWSRIHYYREYMLAMKAAMDDGANVVAYFAWSCFDNFEWLSGYTSRFGINYVDYTNNLKRVPKLSSLWFREVLQKKQGS